MIRGQSDNDNVRFAGRLTRILPLSLGALPRRRSGLGEGRGEGDLIVQSHRTLAFYGHPALRTPHSALRTGFTLLEVMIACGIFFMATFAILGLVSNTLRNARGIQRVEVDAGMAAA
jgi:hypothetical protein